MEKRSKTTTRSLMGLKEQRPIVAVTAYDTVTGALADQAGVDLILVGDSVGTTLLGFDTTLPVTLDMMVHHAAAVARAEPSALLVADVPFPEGASDYEPLMRACARLMRDASAEAVKIEGGAKAAPNISRLVEGGIPVLGHIGLHPQRVHALGGYRKFGKADAEREALLADANALQDAGAFAIIGEMIATDTAQAIAESLEVPFIGIGCGPHVDGQILVINDLLGYGIGRYPAFSKQYIDMASIVRDAIGHYADEVRSRQFPENKKPATSAKA